MSNKIALFLLCGILGGFSGNALAAGDWGPCLAKDNTVHDYPVDATVTVNDASKNTAGTELRLAKNWSNGTSFIMVCECPDPSSYAKEVDTMVWGESVLTEKGRKISGDQYFKLIPELEVMTMIQVPGILVHVPQKNVAIPNNYNAKDCTGDGRNSFGSSGYLSFVVAQPIQGQVTIPPTTIVVLYATKKKNVYSAQPVSSVSISGSLTFTQGCEVKPGTVLDVPFGEFPASAFKNGKGQMPEGGTKKEINLGFDCNNISDGIKVSLRLEGATNAADSRAVDMGDPNIGVLVTDTAGNVLKPNDTNSTTLLTLSALDSTTHRNAAIQLFASPVSTTNSLPEAGRFEGVTTVLLDME
ncbi:fimbrial protein [Escherichia albertii]|uniref:fimbrial protein n=1 Tax=Escherichia albertii TaxID=208962 RepID=UPI00074429DC|nr:fimbrial protein [Escherichia albertii]